MVRPEEMTLRELVHMHPDPHIRQTARALLDILKDRTSFNPLVSAQKETQPQS